MPLHWFRHLLFTCAIGLAVCAAAPRANALERLCDPSFEDCRAPLLALIFAGQNTVQFGSANYSPNAFVPDAPYTNYVTASIYFTDDPAIANSVKTKFDNLWTDTANFSAYANVTSRVRVHPTYPISAPISIFRPARATPTG